MHNEHVHQVNGLHIHSFSAGSGDPLVFLHGWSVHAGGAQHVRESLEKTHCIFTPSLVGHGKSHPLPRPDFTVRDFGKLYADWIIHLGIRNATLVGHSFGGAVAIVAASLLPASTLRRLVLIDPLGAPIQRTRTGWNVRWLQKELQNITHAPRRYVQNVVSPFGYNLRNNTRDLFRLAEECKRLDVRAEAKKISIPTLILWGDRDVFVPISVGEELASIMPHAMLQVVPGMHDWPLLNPAALAKALE
ncbi:MAG: alpha/beta hydrolase [Patescibacteria group bacterium]